MSDREELGIWAYLAIFLFVLLSLALNIKDFRSAYAGENPLDMRHPWSKSPAEYVTPQAEAPSTEYASAPG